MAEAEQQVEDLVRTAHRAVRLAALCVVIAIVVLAIDNRLKREIIRRGQEALRLLDEARRLAEEARDGRTAGQDGTAPGAGIDAGDGVVHAPAASAAADHDAGTGPGTPANGSAGRRGGAVGNGRRASRPRPAA